MASNRLCFVTEWVDPASGVCWKYQFFWYPDTAEVEMIDIKNRRHFLKKIKSPEQITLQQLYLGATVTVYARQLKLIEYGDEFTRAQMESRTERTLALIKPDAYKNMGKILHAIHQSGFIISKLRVCKLIRQEAEAFYATHAGKPFFDKLVDFMSSGRICALELLAPGAIQKWRQVLGPTDSQQARAQAPNSIRALFGTDTTYNACHGSDAPETAEQELAFFFSQVPPVGKCDVGKNTTLGVLRPHLVKDGLMGLALDCVQDRFEVTAAQTFNLDKAAAGEFLEVYKGVLSPGQFNAQVDELTSGPCLAFEVADRDGAPCVEQFRELCGPMDPELARVLRPKSLRAMFGVNSTSNGVHCTDLPEDGELEVQYFFSILQ